MFGPSHVIESRLAEHRRPVTQWPGRRSRGGVWGLLLSTSLVWFFVEGGLGFLDEAVDGVVGSGGFFGGDVAGSLWGSRCPSVAPAAGEEGCEADVQGGCLGEVGEVVYDVFGLDHHVDGGEFAFGIAEQHFGREVRRFDIVGLGDVAANRLDRVVQHQAQRRGGMSDPKRGWVPCPRLCVGLRTKLTGL